MSADVEPPISETVQCSFFKFSNCTTTFWLLLLFTVKSIILQGKHRGNNKTTPNQETSSRVKTLSQPNTYLHYYFLNKIFQHSHQVENSFNNNYFLFSSENKKSHSTNLRKIIGKTLLKEKYN